MAPIGRVNGSPLARRTPDDLVMLAGHLSAVHAAELRHAQLGVGFQTAPRRSCLAASLNDPTRFRETRGRTPLISGKSRGQLPLPSPLARCDPNSDNATQITGKPAPAYHQLTIN